jgi:hypothetical protein
MSLEAQYCARNYLSPPVVLTRGEVLAILVMCASHPVSSKSNLEPIDA